MIDDFAGLGFALSVESDTWCRGRIYFLWSVKIVRGRKPGRGSSSQRFLYLLRKEGGIVSLENISLSFLPLVTTQFNSPTTSCPQAKT